MSDFDNGDAPVPRKIPKPPKPVKAVPEPAAAKPTPAPAPFVPRHFSPAHLEQWWVNKAREDPLYFIWYLTEYQPARHHEIWMKSMLAHDVLRLNIIAPRESSKTTITVYTIAWLMASNPFDTFGIIAVSSTIARDRLSMLRGLFSENTRFRNVFPHIQMDKKRPDTQDEFSIWSERSETGKKIDYRMWRTRVSVSGSQLNKNPSIFAAGNGGKGVIGRRISGVLLLDDMVDETFLSIDAQNKMMRYINQTIEPCITEEGRIWNIGTRWMLDDIYEQLSKNAKWKTITIPAILYDEAGTAFSYWPQFWPLTKLENKRLTMNDDLLFRIMYLCDPSAVTASLFRREALFKGLPQVLPEFIKVFVTTDFAVSMQHRADFNVLYIVGVDRQDNVYVLDGIRYKDEAPDSVDKITQLADAALYMYGRLDAILIEHVGFQLLFEQLIRAVRPDLPVIAVPPKGDKMHRAKQVSYWALKQRLFINQELFFIEDLRKEWFNFPMAKHDDTLDALSILFQYLTFGHVSAQLIQVKPQNMEQVMQAKILRLRRA